MSTPVAPARAPERASSAPPAIARHRTTRFRGAGRHLLVWSVVVAASGGAPACGTSRAPRGAQPATPVAGAPVAPTRGLPLPSLDVDWSPPTMVAGDIAALGQALADARRVRLMLPLGLHPAGDASIVERLRTLAPDVAWSGPLAGGIDQVVGPRELVPRPDVNAGGPVWRWDEVQVQAELAASHVEGAGEGAGAVLVLDEAPFDSATWRAQPAWSTGGCEALQAELAVGQEHALAELEPFVDHFDARLLDAYRGAMRVALPRRRKALEGEGTSGADACLAARRAHLDGLRSCTAAEDEAAAGRCPSAPRVFIDGVLSVAMTLPDVDAPACAAAIARDDAASLREHGARDVSLAFDALQPRWVTLADRVAALGEVARIVDEACAPRRGRLGEADLSRARTRMAAVGERLASPLAVGQTGTWQRRAAVRRVPGVGAVMSLWQWQRAPGHAAAVAVRDAKVMAAGLRDAGGCRGDDPVEPPWVAMLLDPAPSPPRVTFLTFVYREQLLCTTP